MCIKVSVHVFTFAKPFTAHLCNTAKNIHEFHSYRQKLHRQKIILIGVKDTAKKSLAVSLIPVENFLAKKFPPVSLTLLKNFQRCP
jgi:hypothetical protein